MEMPGKGQRGLGPKVLWLVSDSAPSLPHLHPPLVEISRTLTFHHLISLSAASYQESPGNLTSKGTVIAHCSLQQSLEYSLATASNQALCRIYQLGRNASKVTRAVGVALSLLSLPNPHPPEWADLSMARVLSFLSTP